MDNKQFNERRFNRKKQKYRFLLGIQQLVNYPLLNILWVLFAVGVVLLTIGEKKLVENIEVYPMFEEIFSTCMMIILIVFPVICAVGLIQFIGKCFAVKDEASIDLVFGSKGIAQKQPPILVYKKKDRKSGVVQREFYTIEPMKKWQENKEAICDVLNCYMLGEMTYGGRKKNKGQRIYFESTKGRKPKERGILYDDSF